MNNKIVSAPLKENFFLNIHFKEWQGKTNVFPIIDFATVSQNDGLIHEMELTLYSDEQKKTVEDCLINYCNAYYSRAFYSEQEAEEWEESLCLIN